MTSTKIHGQYAKAREVDKKYMEAARAYETAKEYDSAIRFVVKLRIKLSEEIRGSYWGWGVAPPFLQPGLNIECVSAMPLLSENPVPAVMVNSANLQWHMHLYI